MVCNVTSTASYNRQQGLPLRRTSILRLFQLITSLATGCHPIVLGGLQSSGLPYICKRNWHPANSIDACESRSPGAVVVISSWHAYGFGMPFFAPLRATSKPSAITGHTCTPPRSCSSGDLQRDRVQRLLCLEDDATLRGAEMDRLDGDVAICGGLDDSHHERRGANENRTGVRTKDREKLRFFE
jgi:hypothetical protein